MFFALLNALLGGQALVHKRSPSNDGLKARQETSPAALAKRGPKTWLSDEDSSGPHLR